MNDDLPLIRRVLAGDRDSFRVLVERYQGPVCCFVRNLIADTHDWEDIAQETFLAAYLHLRTFDPRRAAFSTWLLTIARNKAVNARKKKRPEVGDAVAERPDPHSPDQNAADEEWNRLLDQALAALPVEQKAAFVLAEIQELPLEQVGQIEGIKIGTVKSRLSRAKEKLRTLLQRPAEQPNEPR